ncbi:hypothetical protein U9M48_006072 [Paspalum notatum var. saurae]|uniref:Cytochrome P450 n=1 Tax=Paspalum notatum var. saurae TaxID=547442 RepID=A0AAQ3SKG2_PASNO
MEPTKWPILGHLPGLIANIHHLHDWSTGVLAGAVYNFEGRGGWTGLRYFITCDPSNVRHIFTSNFANYPKGDVFAMTFDILGGGIFSADGESWRRQRVKVQMLMADPRFRALTARCSHDKVEKSLLPFLALAADEGRPCDLVDVFLRITLRRDLHSHLWRRPWVLGDRAASGSLHARHGRCIGNDFPPPRHPRDMLEADEKVECWAGEEDGRCSPDDRQLRRRFNSPTPGTGRHAKPK